MKFHVLVLLALAIALPAFAAPPASAACARQSMDALLVEHPMPGRGECDPSVRVRTCIQIDPPDRVGVDRCRRVIVLP